MTRRLLLLIVLCLAAAMALAPGAGAHTFETHTLAGTFDAHDANGAKAFEVESLERIAIDNTTETVYVGGRNDIYKFDSSGASQPYSALAPETVIREGISTWPYDIGDVAVDNSGGTTQGRIYAWRQGTPLRAYEMSGEKIAGGAFPLPIGERECGMAMEPDGNFWLRSSDGIAVEYQPDGTKTGREVEFEGFNFSCLFAVDGEDFLVPSNSGGLINKFDLAGHLIQRIDGVGTAKSVAVDSSNGEIYVDTQRTINHYSSSGLLLDSFGTLYESQDLAVDPVNHDVYALDYGPPLVVQKFVPSGTTKTVPDAVTEAADEVTRVGATVHGTVKPDGSPITECEFEYSNAEYGGEVHTIPCAEGNTFGAETAVSAVIDDVEPAYEYQYRLRVANADGAGYGSIGTFKTPKAVKDLKTEPATGVDFSHATLHGSFDPEGIETEYWFSYGTYAGGAEFFESPHKSIDTNGTVYVQEALSGLEAGTSPQGREFFFTLIAKNKTGQTYSEGLAFTLPPAVQGVATGAADELSLTSATFHGSLEPQGVETHYFIEYGPTAAYGGYAPAPPPGEVSSSNGVVNLAAHVTGLPSGSLVHYRMVAVNSTGETAGEDTTVLLGERPSISADRVNEVNTDTAVLEAVVNPNNRGVTYHWEYGLEECQASTCIQTEPKTIPGGSKGVLVHYTAEGLTPGSTYYFRLIAENELGETVGSEHFFITYSQESGVDECPNVLARKQTGAAATRHCRAYELVSAADTSGYDVESNLIAGQHPLPGFPNADGRVLYSVRNGSVPGSGNPTNKGGDPYLATRNADGWKTEYLGFQANGSPSTKPFASSVLEADQGLGAVAFGGPELCSPCFEDGSKNIPLRLGSGPIQKGMAGELEPAAEPAGEIAKVFSADGSHFVFGSTSKFELAGNEGSLSIYERDLRTGGGTELVSTMPDGSTMPGPGTAELDLSADGSRVLLGREVGTDAAGNRLYDLYMHFAGVPDSVEVVSSAHGVLYNGMTADGSQVFFTTSDQLAGDSDEGADLFRADVDSTGSAIARVSSGGGGTGNSNACNPAANSDGNHWNMPGGASAATCGVVAIGGGGGIASVSGTAYFLSPEQLGTSEGAAGQPNLYAAVPGSTPEYLNTLDPDNPLVRDSVAHSATRESADFQTTPDGVVSVYGNGTALTENNTAGHAEIYRSELGGGTVCVSCIPSNSSPSTDTKLTENGLNLVDDGRVFFTSSEQLVLRDTNQLEDAYEWDEGTVSLISTGLDSNDSGLLTASADGRDAFFFTRQSLAPQDESGGAMKIYDAREGGGFLYNPPPRPCVASDECHGPGTQQAQPPAINTVDGNGREQKPQGAKPKQKHCRRGTVKRHGKCVKTRKHHKKHHRGGKGRNHG